MFVYWFEGDLFFLFFWLVIRGGREEVGESVGGVLGVCYFGDYVVCCGDYFFSFGWKRLFSCVFIC